MRRRRSGHGDDRGTDQLTDPADSRRVYNDGVRAVERVAAQITDGDWHRPACGHWSATSTARHLLTVAGWYHQWLDRAIAGDASPPFDGADIDAHNEQALARSSALDGRDAVAAFTASADEYLDRALEHWDTPFGYPFGVVTTGLHVGVAAAEWHIHAWDLSTVTPSHHTPDDPSTLFIAAGRCVAAAQGGTQGLILGRLVPLGARGSPWPRMLKRSGRL